jgi:hypothetical protein
MDSDHPAALVTEPVPAGALLLDDRTDGDGSSPEGGIDFIVTIASDGDEPPRIIQEFRSVDDYIAVQRAMVEHGVGALVRQAMGRHAENPTAALSANASVPVAATADSSGAATAPARFMKVKAYAARVGYSQRTIENFIDEGLPTVGQRRLLRIDVEPADEWIRTLKARRRGQRDAVEEEAREDARRQGTVPHRRRT